MKVCFRHEFELSEIKNILSEIQAEGNTVFLSEEWIVSWLSTISLRPVVCTFVDEGRYIGLAFIGVATKRKYGISWRVGFLNQLGDIKNDQIWVEHNKIICRQDNLAGCISVLLDTVFDELSISEFVISMADDHTSQEVSKHQSNVLNHATHSSYTADISKKADIESILNTFSRNTRSQIRKAIKFTEKKFGSLSIYSSKSPDERKLLWDELAKLHRIRWCNTPEGSGFDNLRFLEFHLVLMSHAPDSTVTLCLKAGKTSLAYAYYLIHQDSCYFYCSGIDYEPDKQKCKPGYLLHVYAMQYFASMGLTCYDFLGGTSQYKRSLSTNSYKMHSFSLVPNTFKGLFLKLMYRGYKYLRKL